MSGTEFQGNLADFLGNFKSLIDLDLHNCSILGPITQSQHVNSSQLTSLDLSDNNIQGPIPALIFDLTQLRSLRLNANNFSGIIDLVLFHNFKNLTNLDLSYNSLTVVNDARSNSTSTFFPQLEFLYLTSCNMSKFPDLLRNQKEMVKLDLSCNKISGKIPKWIWSAVRSRCCYLNMSNNALEGLEGPFPHLSLTSMRELDLSDNFLKGSTLIPPPSSIIFSLANNLLYGDIPSRICDAKFLQTLDLSSNNFTGLIPQCLGEFSDDLMVLNLHKNAFSGPLLQKFKAGSNLMLLDLSNNELEGKMPMSLAKCEKLIVLNLAYNHIQDSLPSYLASLLQLRILVLRPNQFYGSISSISQSQSQSQSKAFFPHLQIIDVSFNSLSGKLPSNLFSTWKMMKDGYIEFWYIPGGMVLINKGLQLEYHRILTSLVMVDLSHNQFHGNIPSSIGELESLVMLNLSHNHFEGQIPSSIANLKQLESLDLSQNSLSGKIPEQISKLSFLEVVNLSENHLKGSIPQGGHFGTFQNNSFLGNPRLCGPPLSSKCKEGYAFPPLSPPRLSSSPSSKSKKKHESQLNFMWMGFAVGHAVGFGVFFWTMVLWRKGRHAFFELFDKFSAFITNLFLGKKL